MNVQAISLWAHVETLTLRTSHSLRRRSENPLSLARIYKSNNGFLPIWTYQSEWSNGIMVRQGESMAITNDNIYFRIGSVLHFRSRRKGVLHHFDREAKKKAKGTIGKQNHIISSNGTIWWPNECSNDQQFAATKKTWLRFMRRFQYTSISSNNFEKSKVLTPEYKRSLINYWVFFKFFKTKHKHDKRNTLLLSGDVESIWKRIVIINHFRCRN